MKNFIGTYECKIDDKGRIKLPASLTKQMEHFADEPLSSSVRCFKNVWKFIRWNLGTD